MTLREALRQGINRIRRAEWAHDDDNLELPILGDGKYGPWATLHSPAMGRIADELEAAHKDPGDFRKMMKQPMLLLQVDLDADGWEPYINN